MEHFKIFEELKATNSVVEKEALLRARIDDDYLANLLHLNLNPYKLFYIKEMPNYVQSRPPWKSDRAAYREFILLTDKLTARTITGNAARDEVKRVFSNITPSEAEVYKKILLKEAIGVGAATVNKVWANLIPEFKLMLAPSKIPDISAIHYPAFIQPKLDGFRCIYRAGEFWTRGGQPVANKNVKSYLQSVLNVDEWVLDGELYAHGLGFNKLASILTKEDAPIPPSLKFVVYDCISIQDWDNEICKREYQHRLQDLRKVINGTIADYKKVIDIANDSVQSSREAVEKYKEYLKNGYEGAMIKSVTGLYKWKRVTIKSGEMLKIKPFKSVDVIIEGIYDGEGERTGMAGGVNFTYNGVAVRCGSGFDLATLKEMAKSPTNFIGKTVEIKYLEETEDGSLRHPVFSRFRNDKD